MKYIDCYAVDPDTGAVSSYNLTLPVYRDMLAAGISLRDGKFDHDKHYIGPAGNLRYRPEMKATLQGTTIIDLPKPCTIYINDEIYQCDDGTAELEFPRSGIYRILVVAHPYKDKRFQIENRA